MPYNFDHLDNTLSKKLGLSADHLGPSLAAYYAEFDETELFWDSQHGLNIFGINNIEPANYYLLSELQKEDIQASLDPSDPSWKWQVIGDFGTKGESLILDPTSQHLYLFRWVSYPRDQPLLAQNFAELLLKLANLENDDSIHDLKSEVE